MNRLVTLFPLIARWFVIAAVLSGSSCQNIHPNEPDDSLSNEPAQFIGVTEVQREPALETIVRLKGTNLSTQLEQEARYKALLETGAYAEMALAFVARHREEFRLQDPTRELRATRVEADQLGYHQVWLRQFYRELDVAESEILVHFDSNDHIYLIQGRYAPTPAGLQLTPTLSSDEVAAQVSGEFGQQQSHVPNLTILIRNGQPYLAYRVVIEESFDQSWELFVDAHTGSVLRKTSLAYSGEKES